MTLLSLIQSTRVAAAATNAASGIRTSPSPVTAGNERPPVLQSAAARRPRRRPHRNGLLHGGGSSMTGHPRIEGALAFDRALSRHNRAALILALAGAQNTRTMPQLESLVPLWKVARHIPHEGIISVDKVVGTVASGAGEFDIDFLPTTERGRARFVSVFAALHSGEAIPPIEVYQWLDGYYIADGHHRVAAARALGQEFLDAKITELFERAE